MNPRIRRLQADYDSLLELAERSSIITIDTVEGNPPERYEIHINCKGVERIDKSGKPTFSNLHRLELQLHDGYPSRKPFLKMRSKAFHPNISPRGSICIGMEGDHGYAPSMKLADLVRRIIEMIRYENIGLDSPFNMEAKRWAAKNQHLFPLEGSQIVTDAAVEMDIVILDEAPESEPDDLVNEISIL